MENILLHLTDVQEQWQIQFPKNNLRQLIKAADAYEFFSNSVLEAIILSEFKNSPFPINLQKMSFHLVVGDKKLVIVKEEMLNLDEFLEEEVKSLTEDDILKFHTLAQMTIRSEEQDALSTYLQREYNLDYGDLFDFELFVVSELAKVEESISEKYSTRPLSKYLY